MNNSEFYFTSDADYSIGREFKNRGINIPHTNAFVGVYREIFSKVNLVAPAELLLAMQARNTVCVYCLLCQLSANFPEKEEVQEALHLFIEEQDEVTLRRISV